MQDDDATWQSSRPQSDTRTRNCTLPPTLPASMLAEHQRIVIGVAERPVIDERFEIAEAPLTADGDALGAGRLELRGYEDEVVAKAVEGIAIR